MKNKFHLLLASGLLLFCSDIQAASHITCSATNCVQTGNNTMNVDLYLVNDGTTNLKLISLNYGLNVDASTLNGGSMNWVYENGTSDLPSVISSTFSPAWNSTLSELRLTSSTTGIDTSNAFPLPFNTPVRVGTFMITNTNSWVNGDTTNFTLQAVAKAGATNTGIIAYVDTSIDVTNFNTSSNRSVLVDCRVTFLICTKPSLAVADNNSPLCSGSDLSLSSSLGAGTTPVYLWTGPNGFTSSLPNPVIQGVSLADSGSYTVTISNSCGSTDTSTFVSVNPLPPLPIVNGLNDTLYCSTNPAYISYQWYNDSTPVSGTTDTSLAVTGSGNYSVRVTNIYGCSITAGANITLNVPLEINSLKIISISPIPADNIITIQTYSSQKEDVILSVINVLGETMQQEKIKWSNETNMNVKNLSSGIYFLKVQTESGAVIRKFIKE